MPLAAGCLILMLIEFDLPFLVYPLAAGFALIAPFIASGFYVVSSRLEKSEPLSWRIVFGTVKSMFGRDLGWMALVTGFSLFIWMDIAALLSFGFMSFQFFSFTQLLDVILTTPAGWAFLVIGHTAGALIAFGVFSYSVISMPMLFDRDIDFVTAMITSVRFVKAEPTGHGGLVFHHRRTDRDFALVRVPWAVRDLARAGPRDLASLSPRCCPRRLKSCSRKPKRVQQVAPPAR